MIDLTKPIRVQRTKKPARIIADNLQRGLVNHFVIAEQDGESFEHLYSMDRTDLEKKYENVPDLTYRPFNVKDKALFDGLMGRYLVNKPGKPYFRMSITSISTDGHLLYFNRFDANWLFGNTQFENGTPFGAQE